MNSWQTVKLGDFLIINPIEKLSKGTIAKKVSMERLRPFCRDVLEYEFDKFSGGSKFRNKDTIMARITPCLENGKRAQINMLEQDEIGFGSTEFIIFREKENISNSNFIYYLICSDFIREPAIKSMVGSSGRQRVQTDVLKNLILSLPPIDVQKKIAGVLGALDDKIELNNRINNNLEQQAQALFKSWFVDFEPFGGTMPDDWKTGRLEDVADITSGKRPLIKQDNKSTGFSIPVVGASCIMGYTNKPLYNNKIFVTGRVGTHGVIQRFHDACWPSDNTLIIISKYYEYVYQLLKTINYTAMNRGSTQPLITQTDLKNTEIIVPPEDILTDFEHIAGQLMKLYEYNRQENTRLSALRDTLLPKLMSGEIDVSNVDISELPSTDKSSFSEN